MDGKISYDPETNTLTMEDVTINTTGENVGIRNGSVKGLKIVVVGNNTITAKSSCIAINKTSTISGSWNFKIEEQ